MSGVCGVELQIGKPYVFNAQFEYEIGESEEFTAIGYLAKVCESYLVFKMSNCDMGTEMGHRMTDDCTFIGIDFIKDIKEIKDEGSDFNNRIFCR